MIKNKTEEFAVANIEFKDGSTLTHCVIFGEEPYAGAKALEYADEIEQKFKRLPWYSKWDGWIYFQNKYINGCCHVENIRNYEIVFVSKEEF
jgi:hypothetical protein